MSTNDTFPNEEGSGAENSEIAPIEVQPIEPLATPDPEEMQALKSLEERRKKARRRRIIKIVIIICVVIALLAGWSVSCVVRAASQIKVSEPETAVAAKSNLTSTVQATGSLKPGANVAVTPEVSGIIQEVLVTEGQQVQQGDVLLTLKNSELERAVADAESALNQARRSLNNAQEGVTNAQTDYENAVKSFNTSVEKANKAIANASSNAEKAYEKAYREATASIPKSATKEERAALEKEARATAKAAYDAVYAQAAASDPGSFEHAPYLSAINAAQDAADSAQAAVDDAQRNYDYAVEQADKRTVRAPATGAVLDLKADAGAAVGGATGGTSTVNEPLMHIADLSTLSIDTEVNEVDIADIVAGQHASVTFTAVPNLQLDGNVVSVASLASGSSDSSNSGGTAGGGLVTFKVTTTLASTDPHLKPGMSANVSILTKDVHDVLVIPLAAVTEDENGATVEIVTDRDKLTTETRQITITDRSTSQVAVGSGLEEGEVVLVSAPTVNVPGMGSSSSSSSSR